MISPTKPFKLIHITDDPDIARIAATSGVDRIMVDLELIGKIERQGHLDTVISRHSPQAINRVAGVLAEIGQGEVLVRTNPINSNSSSEIEDAIARGAQRFMLPMFRTVDEVSRYLDLVGGRVPIILLLETKGAYQNLGDILKIKDHFEIHVGLNDLHLEMGLDFMFQLLTNGVVDDIADRCQAAGRTFGIGGVAPLSSSANLSPADILAYHLSTGSSCVILSRDWNESMIHAEECAAEIQCLRNLISAKPEFNRLAIEESVDLIVNAVRQK